MSFSQERCCVCLENKNFYTECKHCNDGKYCKKCIVKLIEENKDATCCICRQETWYKDKDKDKMQVLINKHKKKVIGTSLDETIINVNNEENTISNVSDNHEDNFYIIKQIYTILLLSFIIWLIIYGLIKDNKDGLVTNYKYPGLILIFVSILGGCSMFTCFNYIKKHCSCGEFIFAGFCLTISLIFGYMFTFILCELHTNYSNNGKVNSLIIISISLASGIALVIGSLIIIILNKNIYELLKEKCGDLIAECCCNPLFIMIHILISIFIIQIGRMIIFDTIKIDLHVNKEHKLILEILISYLAGLSIFIIPLSLISLICVKDTIFKCKCNCKKERTIQESINIEEII